jgi:predicted nucleic acid-binding protein
MIVVDTAIWIDHFRATDSHLTELLDEEAVLMHPWIVGELACGNLSSRSVTLNSLRKLPQISPANEDEVLFMIEQHKLMGRGIGYVDMHLLASTKLHGATLWSRDKRLTQAAMDLQVAHIAPTGFDLLL